MTRIFISYRRQATGGQTGRLYDRLKQVFGEHNVFMDIVSIPAGETFESYILSEIDRTDVFLAMLSEKTLDRIQDPSDWVRREIAYALSQEHVLVIPVLVDGFAMPDSANLPEDIRDLARRNAELLRHELFDETASRIIRRIQQRVSSQRNRPGLNVGQGIADREGLESRKLSIERLLKDTTAWIQQVQNLDGGLPSDKEGSISCTWTTSGLLWASWNAGISFREFYTRKALSWVLNNRNPDHGIPIVVRGDHSITDATAQTAIACSLAVTELNEEFFMEGLRNCVTWLLYHRLGNMGWNWRPSTEASWLASTCFAILGLQYSTRVLTENLDEINIAIAGAVNWVKSVCNTDGGWGAYEGDRSRAAITGLVCSILKEVDPLFESEQSIDYILAQQSGDGSWSDTIDRPTGHTVTRVGNANCVRALAECGYAIDAETFQKALSALMQTYDAPRFRYRDTDMLSWPTRDGLLALSSLGRQLGLPNCRTLTIVRNAMAVQNEPAQSKKRRRKKGDSSKIVEK